jgi:hypothetical protein
MPRTPRERRVLRAFDQAEARDLRELPHVARVRYPGPYGTFPEDTEGSAPRSPTLTNEPLYTGEWREEVWSEYLVLQANATPLVLATLRRPWPYAGFAVDASKVPSGQTVTFSLRVVVRNARAFLFGNVFAVLPASLPVIGPAPGDGWLAVTGIYAGARLELICTNTPGVACKVRGTLWGYNAPGYGP